MWSLQAGGLYIQVVFRAGSTVLYISVGIAWAKCHL